MNTENKEVEVKKAEKYMPVHPESRRRWKEQDCPEKVPYSLLSNEQALTNHSQTLDRLAERGGLGINELLDNILRQRLSKSWNAETIDDLKELKRHIATIEPASVHDFKSIEPVTKKLIGYMREKFPNCSYSMFINLWDDGTKRIECRYGDRKGYVHIYAFYEEKITFRSLLLKGLTCSQDETGLDILPPEEAKVVNLDKS